MRENYVTNPDDEDFGASTDELIVETSVLTAGGVAGKGAVMVGRTVIDKRDLERHLARIQGREFAFDVLPEFGAELAALVLDEPTSAALAQELEDYHLVVINDAEASRIPWETLNIAGKVPALTQGLSRRYLAEDLSIAKWSQERRLDRTTQVLLVVDPTLDLRGAREEGKRIADILADISHAEVTTIEGAAATRTRLLEAFASGAYDVVHYADMRSSTRCSGHVPVSYATAEKY